MAVLLCSSEGSNRMACQRSTWSIPDCVRTDLQMMLVVASATALPAHAIPRMSQAGHAVSPIETGIDEREE